MLAYMHTLNFNELKVLLHFLNPKSHKVLWKVLAIVYSILQSTNCSCDGSVIILSHFR